MEIFVHEDVFARGGLILYQVYKILLSMFVMVNHLVIYLYIDLLVKNNWLELGLYFALYGMVLLFFAHFYFSLKDIRLTSRFVIWIGFLETVLFLYFLIQLLRFW